MFFIVKLIFKHFLVNKQWSLLFGTRKENQIKVFLFLIHYCKTTSELILLLFVLLVLESYFSRFYKILKLVLLEIV